MSVGLNAVVHQSFQYFNGIPRQKEKTFKKKIVPVILCCGSTLREEATLKDKRTS